MSDAQLSPLIDLDRILAALRLRRRWVRVGAAAGVLFTFAVTQLLLPAQPTATARVLIARADETNSNREVLMATDVALCGSMAVARGAADELGVAPGPLLGSYSCAEVTPNVLRIDARAPSPELAERAAGALVASFVARHLAQTDEVIGAEVADLFARRGKLERTLSQVVASLEEADPDRAQALSGLRTGLVSQIDDLTRRSQDLRATSAVVGAGTQIVDPARRSPPGGVRQLVILVLFGLVLGVGGGVGLAVLFGVVRERPYRRRDIASALGAPVLLDVRSPSGPARWLGRRGDDAAVATLARLVRGAPADVSILELRCSRAAAGLACGVARIGAPARPLVLGADLKRSLPRRVFLRLSAAAQASWFDHEHDRARRAAAGHPPSHDVPPAERTLGFGSLSRRMGWIELRRLGELTILVVRAGAATTRMLEAVARELEQAEIEVLGVVLVDPDPKDHTDGTAPAEFYALMHRHLAWVRAAHGPVTAPAPAPVHHTEEQGCRR